MKRKLLLFVYLFLCNEFDCHDIKNTTRYDQLDNKSEEERFISKVAMNVKEAAELVELGFEYVTGEYDDGGKLFKKKKLSYLGSGSVPGGSWSSMV
jgi:hypothetical protein